MAGAHKAAVAVRTALAEAALIHERDGPPGAAKVIRAGGADDAAAHDQNAAARAAHVRMPTRNGSSGCRSKVASAWMNAEPVMRGRIRPSTTRTLPSNTLPRMLACR